MSELKHLLMLISCVCCCFENKACLHHLYFVHRLTSNEGTGEKIFITMDLVRERGRS